MSETKDQLIEKVISVNRVTKVVKGGRIMGFAALVVVGNGDGLVGMGRAKAKEVSVAVQKATKEARKNMIKVSLKGDTIHHVVKAIHAATTVHMWPGREGTGIIAGGAVRAVCEAVGIHNITAKVQGSTNPYNVVRAVIQGLAMVYTPYEIALKRGKTVPEILGAEA